MNQETKKWPFIITGNSYIIRIEAPGIFDPFRLTMKKRQGFPDDK
jgi:hypothetical protein